MNPEDHLKSGAPMGNAQKEWIPVAEAKEWLVSDGGLKMVHESFPEMARKARQEDFGTFATPCCGPNGVSLHAPDASCEPLHRAVAEIRKDAADFSKMSLGRSYRAPAPEPKSPQAALVIMGAVAIALSALFAIGIVFGLTSCAPDRVDAPASAITPETSTKGKSIFLLQDGTLVIDPATKK